MTHVVLIPVDLEEVKDSYFEVAAVKQVLGATGQTDYSIVLNKKRKVGSAVNTALVEIPEVEKSVRSKAKTIAVNKSSES